MNNLYQSQCYLFVEGQSTWYEALRFCENRNAYLAELIDTEERDAVWNYGKGKERCTVYITDGKTTMNSMHQILVTGIAFPIFLSGRSEQSGLLSRGMTAVLRGSSQLVH